MAYCVNCSGFTCFCSDSLNLSVLPRHELTMPVIEPPLYNPTRYPNDTVANIRGLEAANLLAPPTPGGHIGTAFERSVMQMTSSTMIQRDMAGSIVQIGQIGPALG